MKWGHMHYWWPWEIPGRWVSRARCRTLGWHDVYCRGLPDHRPYIGRWLGASWWA